MKRKAQAGITIPEIIIVVVVLGILVLLALPAITGTMDGDGHIVRTISNMKQLNLATQQMALDGRTIGDTNLGWPGDTGGSFSRWASNAASGGYVSTNDLCKLLSAAGRLTPQGSLPLTNNNAVLVYAVKDKSPYSAVFLTTANFTNTPTGGLPPTADSKPFGNKAFVVFRKGGDGAILTAKQAGYTNLVGTYVPLCK
ncbi:hypothetical protein BH09VER1_BH09VER1_45900 [soil metagenome]